jgi:hypothetical protein
MILRAGNDFRCRGWKNRHLRFRWHDAHLLADKPADPSAPERVFSWLICKSHDDKGNASLYSTCRRTQRESI